MRCAVFSNSPPENKKNEKRENCQHVEISEGNVLVVTAKLARAGGDGKMGGSSWETAINFCLLISKNRKLALRVCGFLIFPAIAKSRAPSLHSHFAYFSYFLKTLVFCI